MRRISLGKWVGAGILLLPTAEIGAFLLVAHWIGWQGAFLLMLATSLLGIAVLGHVGRTVIARFARMVADGHRDAVAVGTGGMLTVMAGLLLVLPGFVTDLLGLLMLVPPARRFIAARFFGRQPDERPDRPAVINLEPTEWKRLPPPRLRRKRPKTPSPPSPPA